MLPRLYSSFSLSNNSYHFNEMGVISNCTKCEVREVRNGAYTLTLETTVNDPIADKILSQRVVGIKPNPTDPLQYFEIQRTSRSLDGKIKVEAKHIKNLCFNICSEGDISKEGEETYITGTPKQIWDTFVASYIPGRAIPFSFASNISTTAAFWLGFSEAESMGNILSGKEGSFTDMWNGEFKWNNFSITFNSSRGRNTGYKLKYGKNISSATQSESCESLYSHVLPYGKVNQGDHKINFYADRFEISGHSCLSNKTFMLDCSSMLDAYSVGPQSANYTEVRAAMTAYAQNYAKVNNLGSPSINIKIDVRATLDEMSSIGLCDTVEVILDNFGTTATAKITDVTYDALLERWTKIVVGTPTVTVADLILNTRRYVP